MNEDRFRAAVAAGVAGSEQAYAELLQSIVQVARAIFKAKGSSIWLLDEGADELVVEAVAREEAFQRHGLVAKALGLRRRAPLSPLFHPPLCEQAADDGGEVRRKAAAPLELTDDGVIVVEQADAHFLHELLGLAGLEMMPPRNERGYSLDRPEMLEICFFRVHPCPHCHIGEHPQSSRRERGSVMGG